MTRAIHHFAPGGALNPQISPGSSDFLMRSKDKRREDFRF